MTWEFKAQHCRPTLRPLQGTLPNGGEEQEKKKGVVDFQPRLRLKVRCKLFVFNSLLIFQSRT